MTDADKIGRYRRAALALGARYRLAMRVSAGIIGASTRQLSLNTGIMREAGDLAEQNAAKIAALEAQLEKMRAHHRHAVAESGRLEWEANARIAELEADAKRQRAMVRELLESNAKADPAFAELLAALGIKPAG